MRGEVAIDIYAGDMNMHIGREVVQGSHPMGNRSFEFFDGCRFSQKFFRIGRGINHNVAPLPSQLGIVLPGDWDHLDIDLA